MKLKQKIKRTVELKGIGNSDFVIPTGGGLQGLPPGGISEY